MMFAHAQCLRSGYFRKGNPFWTSKFAPEWTLQLLDLVLIRATGNREIICYKYDHMLQVWSVGGFAIISASFPLGLCICALVYSSSPSCLGLLPLLDHLVRRLLHTALQTNCTAPHTDSTNSHTNCANHGALCAQTNNTKHTAPGTYNFLYGTIRARFIPYTLLHSLRVNTLTLEGLYRQALFLQRVTWQDWPPHR